MRQRFTLPWLVALVVLTWNAESARATEAIAVSEKGKRIWQEQCVSCHGENGEGVENEYDEPLYGNWSLEKLTRIIHKTMPDDDPDQCVDADADAVARYIYDAFYSLEARARSTPARVELVRLTNRQYLNTTADLLKHFIGEKEVGDARGLRGSYYSARNFDRKEKQFERVDAQVRFDFAESSPDVERFKDEEFSVQWRGSVIADETGEYEFIVRSENGVRLWVNDTREQLIDGWVSSGMMVEHRAKIRLIGGRAYPLRLDFFKFKDKTASVSLEWKPPHGVQQVIPRRSLALSRANETMVVSTPFPPDDRSVGYERGVSVSKAWHEATTYAAIEAANYVVGRLDQLARTKEDADDRSEKVREFCAKFVEIAFRRPLSDEQREWFVDRHFGEDIKLENSVKRVVLLALKSPRFLYLGLNDGPLDSYEVAERLSFELWDSLPDAALYGLAKQGALAGRDQVAAQARRMLDDPRARSKVGAFMHHWLELDRVETLVKDAELYPDFTPEVMADLRTSLQLFLDEILWSERSDYRELLLADHIYLNARLADFYDVDEPVDDFTAVVPDESQRAGVITHPYLLASFSYPTATSPIHRGVFLTRNIVGRALKPPPVAIEFKDNDFPEDLTMREKVAELTKEDACQSCHSVINPLGFSLEHFDAVGRWRMTENEKPVNSVSDYLTDDGETVRLTGARDLAKYAAGSEAAQKGFIEQLWHQVVKQPLLAYGPHVHEELHGRFVQSGFSVQQLMVEIATLAALHDDKTRIAQTD